MYTYTVREMIIPHGNSEVFGKIYLPDAQGRCPAIILSHGYNGCHADFDAECRFYASHGVVAYALDFCGGSTRSRSSGASTEMTLFTEKADLLAVFDHLRTLDCVDAAQIFLMGGSQGGLVTALAAEERADAVKGVILYFPAMNIPDDWRGRYATVDAIPEETDFWGLKLGRVFFTSMRELHPFEVIGGYREPVLIITGDQDGIVSLACVRKTASCYERAELVVLRGEGHGFSPAGNRTAMARALALMQSAAE